MINSVVKKKLFNVFRTFEFLQFSEAEVSSLSQLLHDVKIPLKKKKKIDVELSE